MPVRCLILALFLLPLAAPAPSAADRPTTIREVREILTRGRYPWYDPEKDAPKGLKLRIEDREMSLKFWLYHVVTMLVTAFIVTGLAFTLVRLVQYSKNARRPAVLPRKPIRRLGGASARTLQLPDPTVLDRLAEAQAAAQRADFRTAVVHLFKHLLDRMDRHHIVRLHPGRTNRQYFYEIRDGRDRDTFHQLARLFERVVFGARAADHALYEQALALVLGFEQSLTAAGSDQPAVAPPHRDTQPGAGPA